MNEHILNVLNGDCALPAFEASALPGGTLVWREVYTEGPLEVPCDPPRFRPARAEFLSSITGYSVEKMAAWTEKLDRTILSLRTGDTLRLWFDACMFDQSILARILFLLSLNPASVRPRVELACADVVFAQPEVFPRLDKTRTLLSDTDIQNGALCWKCFAEYRVPEEISPVFVYLRSALERRVAEKPGGDGLGVTHRRILALAARNAEQGISREELFPQLSAQEKYPWFGPETVERLSDFLVKRNLLRRKDGKYYPV